MIQTLLYHSWYPWYSFLKIMQMFSFFLSIFVRKIEKKSGCWWKLWFTRKFKQILSSEATLLVRKWTLLHTSSKCSKTEDKRRSAKQSSSFFKQSCFKGWTLLEQSCTTDPEFLIFCICPIQTHYLPQNKIVMLYFIFQLQKIFEIPSIF